jgi:SAM-dependent methyltransferase
MSRVLHRFRRRPGFAELFEGNEGRLVYKCPHYFPIYDRELGRHRGTSPTVLEIGVFHGGSLNIWKRYFGAGTTVVGIDIDPRCASLGGDDVHVRIGDQSDAEFLAQVSAEFGPFDVVIDDGSHLPRHQILSLDHLWPALAEGGTYLVEDLCTNYWTEYEGGPGAHTFMDRVQALVHDINAFNSRSDDLVPSHWTREIVGMHVYDSVVVLEKGCHEPLTTVMSGRPTFDDVEITPEHRQQLEAAGRNRASRLVRRAYGGRR